MATKLPIKGNEIFYGLSGMDNVEKWRKDIVSDQSYILYEKNEESMRNLFGKDWVHIYKKKYYITNDHEKPSDDGVFNEKYKFTPSSLGLKGYKTAKSLPKGMLVLSWFESHPFFVLPVEVIPKSIITMFFANTRVPFGPSSDLSSLKNLKVLVYRKCDPIAIPKLPKSIEYLSLSGNSIGNGMWDYTKFKLKDYPKLKYFDISKSMIPKNKIPKEWKEAKKAKKIFVLY